MDEHRKDKVRAITLDIPNRSYASIFFLRQERLNRKTGLVRDREEIAYEDKHKQRRFTRQLKDRVVQAILTPGIREHMVGRGLNITRVRTKQRTRAILGLKMC